MPIKTFQELKAHCQASQLYNPNWGIYNLNDFANSLLPSVRKYEAKAVQVYDGAYLFYGVQASDRQLYQLTDSKNLISLIAFTYPKGVAAEKEKNSTLIVQENEVGIFIEIDEADNIEVFFKLGNRFKDYLREYKKRPPCPLATRCRRQSLSHYR